MNEATKAKLWRDEVKRLLHRRNRYQFGQPPETCSLVQQSGCTDTCIQLIVWMVKGKRVSLNDVRRRSGAPASTPMNTTEALRALHSYGLPYDLRTGILAGEALRIARTKGPVIMAERYWSHPQWKGYRYMGRTLNGYATNDSGAKVRVGLSSPVRRSGMTQWTFRDGHAVLLAVDDWDDGKHVDIVRDPNHNSPSRPERPAYDMLSVPQLNRMLKSWPGSSLALVPTRDIR